MGMVVRTNTMALNAYRQLGMNNSAVAKSLEKLSSGFRINRAGDDAAGLAISEKMKAQITGLETASANAQDGISLIQTAEGNLTEVHSMLNRMVELATKSANGTYTSQERNALQDEVDSLLEEIDRISKSANFNGTKLLDGTMGLNNEGFAIQKSVAANPGGSQAVDASKITVDADHASPTTSETKPTFTANFEEFSVDGIAKTTTQGSVNAAFTVKDAEGNDVKVQFLNAGKNGWDDTVKVKDVTAAAANDPVNITAADMSGIFTANADPTDAAATKVRIGTEVYGISTNANDEVTFTWIGTGKDDGTIDTTASVPENAWIPAGKLSVTVTGDGVNIGSDFTATEGKRADCDVTKVDDPVAGGAKKRAGATLALDADMVKAGSKLKIGDTTFTFTSDAATPEGLQAGGSATDGYTINVGTRTGDDLLKFVSEQMTNAEVQITKKIDGTDVAHTFAITRPTTKSIHIDEAVGAGTAADPSYLGLTEAEMKAAFTSEIEAHNAGTTLTLTDNSKLADEERISVDGKEIKFNKGADAAATLNNLKTALGSNYNATINGNEIFIEAKTDTAPAPVLAGAGLTLQIGDTSEDYNKMTVKVADMSTNGLGIAGLSIMNETSAGKAINVIKNAINTVSTARAGMGALQNRLEHTINNLDVAVENLSAANSRIRDTDMAKEMMNYTKMNVLVQSAQAMLAQANQQPQSVLQLLQ